MFESLKKGITDHFPNKFDDSKYFYFTQETSDSSYFFGNYNIVIHPKAKDEISDFIQKNHSNNYTTLQIFDSCAFLLPYFSFDIQNKDTFDQRLIKSKNKCNKELVPIPDLAKIFSVQDKDFFKKCNFYILEKDSIKLFNYSYKSEGYSVPKKWKNGYLKGVAINNSENVIIYWVYIW